MDLAEIIKNLFGPIIGLGLLGSSAILILMSRTHRLEEAIREINLRSLRNIAIHVQHGNLPIQILLDEMKELSDILSEIPDENIITQALTKYGGGK